MDLEFEKDEKIEKSKFKLINILIISFVSILILRLFYLQVVKGDELKNWSDNNHIRPLKIEASRGMIFDSQGDILVDNKPSFVAVVVPQYASKLNETSKQLAKILNLDANEIILKVKDHQKTYGQFKPVSIKEDLTRDEVSRLEMIKIKNPGLKVEMKSKRHYALGENGASLFGYVGEVTKNQIKDNPNLKLGNIIGRRGLEFIYDKDLRGVDGSIPIKVDAFGRESQDINTPEGFSSFYNEYYKEPNPGHSIFLTLDKKIQNAAYNAMVSRNRVGAVLVLENKTGAVLSWVNLPSFDPHLFWPRISFEDWQILTENEYKPLRDKVVQDHFAPGSIFKTVVAFAGLEENIITKEKTQDCPGHFKFGRRIYHCWKRSGHGKLNVIDALSQSCNVFFYKLGNALGVDTIAKYAKALGFGRKTRVNVLNEQEGLVPTTSWKKDVKNEHWIRGETLSTSVGQGFLLSTVMQVANLFSIIANEGFSYKPHLVSRVTRADGLVIEDLNEKPEILSDVRSESSSEVKISELSFQIVKEGLYKTVNSPMGTAKWYKLKDFLFAGKTGTSQIVNLTSKELFSNCKSRPPHLRHHGWFASIGPYSDPEIVTAVLTLNSCSGSSGSAPISRDIYGAYLDKLIGN